MSDNFFDRDVAADYDQSIDPAGLDRMVETLAELADGGTALEFAIGTGRVALPLMEAGISVAGIEKSRAMVQQLRSKAGSSKIDVTIGDMATTYLNQTFDLVFLVYNTIDNLTSQDAQVACFCNAARHLRPGGVFVVETLVPPLQRLPEGETLLAYDRSSEHWGTDEINVVDQTYTSHHIRRTDKGFRTNSVPFRYVWPSELNLMARMAGLEFHDRWSDWAKSPFDAVSRSHVSTWSKPNPA